jgi:glycosyltransferase involved in cell wall biosynthesis
MKTLSIIIPVYNEEKTISKVLDLVLKARVNVKKEIIIIDDGSTDNSKKIISNYIKKSKKVKFIFKSKKNGGKGSAVKEGIKLATGDVILIQDADLEYNPNEYQQLISPILNKDCKVVYGSRMLKKNKKYSSIPFYMGGILVTFITNILFNSKITDEPTCYKVFDTQLIKSIKIEGNGFEWEPEVTAKILKKGIKIKEVPISYYPRTIKEGKKINWKDGLKAILTLIKYRF